MRWFDIADELLPPVYQKIRDMYAYAKSLNDECKGWISYMDRILANFFIQTCDTQTLRYWELLLGIILHGGETIEQRRNTILAYLNNTNAITEPYVRSVLDRLFPNDRYTLWFDVGNDKPYDLYIDIYSTDDAAIREFNEWFTKMCPAHLCQSSAKAIETSYTQNAVMNHSRICAMSSALPNLTHQYTPPPSPEPPTPPTPVGSIYIGVTTTCEDGTTTLNSPYFWMYAFQNASGTNWYTPGYYQSATPPVTDNDLQSVGGTRYEEVVLTDGDNGTFSPTMFRLAEWSSKPEFYMNDSYSSVEQSKNGAVIKFGSDIIYQTFNLPLDMYSISGTTITWNMSHPLMVLLLGKECN